MATGWDNATLKKLKSLTGRGLSTAEIGKKLGMSKNAVVGKLNRLGWNAGAEGKPAPATPAVPKAVAKKPAAPVKKATPAKQPALTPAPKPAAPKATAGKNLAMHQRIVQHSMSMAGLRADQCRWPIGDPDSEHFHFCGEPVFKGKPYCYEHCRQAYQFAPPKKK